MNVILNKDISRIHETVFFGLPMRETILGGATIAIGLLSHTLLYEYIVDDTMLNLVTALCCVPTGFLVVYKYQGMKGEQLFLEFVHSLFIKEMVLTAENDLSDQVKELAASREKEGLKIDKINKNKARREKRKLQAAKKGAGHSSV